MLPCWSCIASESGTSSSRDVAGVTPEKAPTGPSAPAVIRSAAHTSSQPTVKASVISLMSRVAHTGEASALSFRLREWGFGEALFSVSNCTDLSTTPCQTVDLVLALLSWPLNTADGSLPSGQRGVDRLCALLWVPTSTSSRIARPPNVWHRFEGTDVEQWCVEGFLPD